MPIYEYQCLRCSNEFQELILKAEEEKSVCCPVCRGRSIKRIMSRVAYQVSEGDRLAAYDPSARQSDSFYRDSRNIGLHAEKRAKELGVDLGQGFHEKLEKLRTDPGSVFREND